MPWEEDGYADSQIFPWPDPFDSYTRNYLHSDKGRSQDCHQLTECDSDAKWPLEHFPCLESCVYCFDLLSIADLKFVYSVVF